MFVIIIMLALMFFSSVNTILKWCKYYDDSEGYLKIDNIG